MSRHLSTRYTLHVTRSKSMHAFLSNLANRQSDRQTDKRTRANAFTSSFVGGNDEATTQWRKYDHYVESRFDTVQSGSGIVPWQTDGRTSGLSHIIPISVSHDRKCTYTWQQKSRHQSTALSGRQPIACISFRPLDGHEMTKSVSQIATEILSCRKRTSSISRKT